MFKWFVRYGVFIVGLYLLALGVVLIVRTSLGTSPISSLAYVVSIFTPLTLGTATLITNLLMILCQFWFIRGIGTRQDRLEIMLQIPFSVLFGAFLDMNMYLTDGLVAESYIGAILMLTIGCTIQALGVALEMKPNVVAMSAEGFVKYASRRYNRNFGKTKVSFDLSLVTIAILASLAFCGSIIGVREGTVIAAIITGLLVNFMNFLIVKRLHFSLLLRLTRRNYSAKA